MAASAGARTGERAVGRDIAVIQDTSEILVSGVAAGRAGFGPIGKGGATRGVLVHAAIAVDGAGALLGLVDEQVWTRKGGKRESDRTRPFAEKESYRWLGSCEAKEQSGVYRGLVISTRLLLFRLSLRLAAGQKRVVK